MAAAGDGRDGYASLAPYDAIYVGGACERVPPKLVERGPYAYREYYRLLDIIENVEEMTDPQCPKYIARITELMAVQLESDVCASDACDDEER